MGVPAASLLHLGGVIGCTMVCHTDFRSTLSFDPENRERRKQAISLMLEKRELSHEGKKNASSAE